MIDDTTVEWLRSKSSRELIARGAKLNQMARTMVADETRRRQPDWGDDQVAEEVVRRFHADENLPTLYASHFREACDLD